MLQKTRTQALIFSLGAIGYCLIELLWRGRTHPTMAVAGGLSFCLISLIQVHLKEVKFMYRCILSGIGITVIELAFGIVFNIILKYNVWDYSSVPINFLGQVCLLYTVLWCFLSVPMLQLSEFLYSIPYKKAKNG